MKDKVLFLITAEFPYGNSEVFLETEILFLAKSFKQVVIISSFDKQQPNSKPRPIPGNCNVYNLPNTYHKYTAISLLKYFSRKDIWVELFDIVRKLDMKSLILGIKTMLVIYHKAFSIKTQAANCLRSEAYNSPNIFFYSYWMNELALGICLLRRNYPKATIISRAHGWDLYEERTDIWHFPFRKIVIQDINKIFTISKHGKEYLENKHQSSVNKIALSRLGILNPYKARITPIKNKLRIISVSSIYWLKRVPLIAQSLACLPPSVHVEWTHIGSGPDMDDLASIVESLSKNDHICINLLGELSNLEVMNYYNNNQIDLFINVSVSEGLPVSMMEAMSFGVPVIGTAVGGVPEIVSHKKNGFLLEENPSVKDIADAIRYFYDLNDSTYIEYRKEAYNVWEANFDASKNYPAFVNMIS